MVDYKTKNTLIFHSFTNNIMTAKILDCFVSFIPCLFVSSSLNKGKMDF